MSYTTSSDKFDHCLTQSHINELITNTTCSEYNKEKCIDTNFNNNDILSTEFSKVESERRLNEYKNVLDNYSNYNSIYDENNNCMLTNLNEFGIHFFDTNAGNREDNCNIPKYLYDSSSFDLDSFFDTASSQRLESIDSQGASDNDETYNDIDDSINDLEITNDILIDNNKIQSDIETDIKYKPNTEADKAKSDEYPIDSDKISEIDIEDNLKCNLIVKKIYNEIRIEKANADIDDDTKIKVCIDDAVSNNFTINTLETVQDAAATQVQDSDIYLNGNQSDDSDKYSYHSSDFEFINESEAYNGSTKGLEYKFNPSTKGIKNISQETVDITKELQTNIIHDYFNKSEPGTENVIPIGNDYNNLFQRHTVPYPCKNIENKAVHSLKGMSVCDTRLNMKCLLHPSYSNSKLKEEAEESAKIIVSMYPNENRRISLRAKDTSFW